ncbi:MAG: helix-turn-helix domain-containing protein [Faecalibacterium sp.]|uniref:helix-turn-helix domain-containing protein n=1 Tax=Faecalibacterium sp. TaxID=1971605 RepID=UPI00399484CC
MIHAYDKSYLSAAQKNLARMLDYLVNDLHYPLETAWQWFVTSELSARFEQGGLFCVGGLVRCRTCPRCTGAGGRSRAHAETLVCLRPQPGILDRLGSAYYQWLTGLRFAEIEQAVSIAEVRLLYTPYHEMDVRQFADKMNELYRAAKPETNLKAMRALAGLSQSELAGRADVPVRTIQQYEQRQKDINKAQAETLLRLARALNCNVEDLMEKVPPLNFK